MTLQQNKQYYGFYVKQIQPLPELYGTGYVLEHQKSGARLCYIQCDDENKVFSISFRTPPTDDCGTAHILEHSVLCGSRKYQIKDPFNELAKGSLNTFLNAMTYSDKTMYPIASCNEKDFFHMMDVYLDAVFYPNIYEKEGIFLQEGWRYEADTATGVVLNEMKGVYADAENRLAEFSAKTMFGDTTYGFESGGKPEAILDLTYEQFLSFHKKYYHPSNSYIYLYGDLDIEKSLQLLDTEYLSQFEKIEDFPEIKTVSVKNSEQWHTGYFPTESEQSGYISYNVKIGTCTEQKKILAMQLIGYLLLETNASPLKNALRDANICEEAEGYFDSSTYELVYSIIAKKVDAEKVETFEQILHTVLSELAEHGFEAEFLNGAIKKYEFLLREEDCGGKPKGLIYNTRLMKHWLHGENPLDALHIIAVFQELKKDIENGYLQEFLSTYFLNNTQKTKVLFLPDATLQQKEQKAFQEKLERKLQSMGEQKNKILSHQQQALQQFQNQEDTPELLAQIPLLSLEDVSKQPQHIEHHTKKADTINYEFVPLHTNGIAYIQLLFHTEHIPQELVPYTGLLAELWGKLDTIQTDFVSLPKKSNLLFGGLAFSNDIYSKNDTDYVSFVGMNFKAMYEDLKDCFAFGKEVFKETKFEMIAHIQKIIKTAKLKNENYFQTRAHVTAIGRSRAGVSAGASIKEQTSGIAYHQFLSEVETLLEQNPNEVIENLKHTANLFCQKQYLTAVVGCEESQRQQIESLICDFANAFSECDIQQKQQPKYEIKQECFSIPSAVQYNIKTWDLAKTSFEYHGKLAVLKVILSLEYLWNQVRVQGGAYGAGCSFQKNGSIYFYSYRDPNVKATYNIYDKLYEQIATFEADERQMTKYILGTINDYDQPKQNSEKMDMVAAMIFTGITDEARQRERSEILSTTVDDIRSCVELLKEIAESENICTIGGAEQLKNMFTNIEVLVG